MWVCIAWCYTCPRLFLLLSSQIFVPFAICRCWLGNATCRARASRYYWEVLVPFQPAHSCSKRCFHPVYVTAVKGCSLQWSGRACTASAAKQDGLEPRAEGHQPCPTADFQCSEMKDESVRNQAGNLIFSKETMDRISVFPQCGFDCIRSPFSWPQRPVKFGTGSVCPINIYFSVCFQSAMCSECSKRLMPCWFIQ